jgi:molecular chaperone Hsp33
VNAAARPGEATVRRYLDREHDVIVLVAEFASLFAAYLDHVRRWESEPDGLSQTLMRQGLGAAVLHLACRPPGETVGWTINFHQPPTNVFLTGDSDHLTVTGRIFTENVRPAERSRMYVQTSRGGGTPTVSTVDVHGHDVLEIFERYYGQSEQTPARFFEFADEEFGMLVGLAHTDGAWLSGLSRPQAIDLARRESDLLDQRTYRLQCGCSPEKILDAVRGLYPDRADDLFAGEPGVEVFCPRCGRRWWVERADFDGAAE